MSWISILNLATAGLCWVVIFVNLRQYRNNRKVDSMAARALIDSGELMKRTGLPEMIGVPAVPAALFAMTLVKKLIDLELLDVRLVEHGIEAKVRPGATQGDIEIDFGEES